MGNRGKPATNLGELRRTSRISEQISAIWSLGGLERCRRKESRFANRRDLGDVNQIGSEASCRLIFAKKVGQEKAFGVQFDIAHVCNAGEPLCNDPPPLKI